MRLRDSWRHPLPGLVATIVTGQALTRSRRTLTTGQSRYVLPKLPIRTARLIHPGRPLTPQPAAFPRRLSIGTPGHVNLLLH